MPVAPGLPGPRLRSTDLAFPSFQYDLRPWSHAESGVSSHRHDMPSSRLDVDSPVLDWLSIRPRCLDPHPCWVGRRDSGLLRVPRPPSSTRGSWRSARRTSCIIARRLALGSAAVAPYLNVRSMSPSASAIATVPADARLLAWSRRRCVGWEVFPHGRRGPVETEDLGARPSGSFCDRFDHGLPLVQRPRSRSPLLEHRPTSGTRCDARRSSCRSREGPWPCLVRSDLRAQASSSPRGPSATTVGPLRTPTLRNVGRSTFSGSARCARPIRNVGHPTFSSPTA